MADGYLIHNQTLNFTFDSETNLYGSLITDSVPTLIDGCNYIVIWDGTYYTFTAEEKSNGSVTGIAMGNTYLGGFGEDTKESFVIGYFPDSNYTAIFTSETTETHVVGIYQLEETSGWLAENKTISVVYNANVGLGVSGAMSLDGGGTWSDAITNTETQPVLGVMFTPGKDYTVIWDNTEYVCTAKIFNNGDPSELLVGVGNFSFGGMGEDTKEPFAFGRNAEGSVITEVFYTNDTADATHTVSVYAGRPADEETTTGGYLFENAELVYAEEDDMWFAEELDGIGGLTIGQTYTITINGTDYVCTAWDDGSGVVCFGNKVEFGEDTGEPFFAFAEAEYNAFGVAWLGETPLESCTVSLYEGVKSDDSGGEDSGVDSEAVNVVLYNSSGRATTYYGIKTVTLNTDVPNETETFSLGTAPDETKVELDLSDGNQVVENTETHLLKKVVIQKPASLTPENIKKGVEIAGVEGDLIGEGVSKEVELSLAEGDQNVEADPDTLMSNVLIKKPETLLAENIKKGVEIAGVVGTMFNAGVIKEFELNNLDLSDGSDSIIADGDDLMSEVVLIKPDALVPDNIINGVEIAGIVGKASRSDFNAADDNLKYFAYQLDTARKVVILCNILYSVWYADNGNYNVVIPDTLGGYSVEILSEY